MSLEKALAAHLLAQAGLTALIGNRLYPLIMPQGAQMPAVTFQRISTRRFHAFGADADLQQPRIQFDAWGSTYDSAKAVAAQLLTALQNASGTLGAGGHTVTKAAVLTQDEADSFEPDTKRYRVRIDFLIAHEE